MVATGHSPFPETVDIHHLIRHRFSSSTSDTPSLAAWPGSTRAAGDGGTASSGDLGGDAVAAIFSARAACGVLAHPICGGIWEERGTVVVRVTAGTGRYDLSCNG